MAVQFSLVCCSVLWCGISDFGSWCAVLWQNEVQCSGLCVSECGFGSDLWLSSWASEYGVLLMWYVVRQYAEAASAAKQNLVCIHE